MQHEFWWSGCFTHDLDVLPQDTQRPSGAKGLHRGFFCTEAARQVLGGELPALAVRNLPVSEDAVQEPLSVALKEVVDSANRFEVDSNREYRPGRQRCMISFGGGRWSAPTRFLAHCDAPDRP